MNREAFFNSLVDMHEPPTVYELIPKKIYEYAYKKFEIELSELYYGYIIVIPLTPEGEEYREYLYQYHHDENGCLIHQSIDRYGAYEYNMKYEGELYSVILVNQD